MQEFLNKRKQEASANIVIDFDGPIHRYSKGFHDGTVYDEPTEGIKVALHFLSKKYKIIIQTCKARPERPLINGKTGTEMIWEWLKKHRIDKYINKVTHEKVPASFYIDDKGIRFTNWPEVGKLISTL